MKLQPLPKLRPITKISPTLFATLKQCPLRVGLSQARAQRTTRSSTAALLGTIAHRVLEKASTINRNSEDLRAHVETMWDKTVEIVKKELKTSPLDRCLLPISRWRKYFLLRERTIRRCVEIASSHSISETRVIASERRFDNVRDGFTGKPDVILRGCDGLVIIDYKSAELPDDVQKREEQIESWGQQVLFYASIVNAEFGEWAVGAEVRLLNKDIIPISINPQEVKKVMQQAQELKDNYNAKIASEVPHSELAQYSVESCAFCEFKGACNTFWKENPQPIPGTDEYGCLCGQVLKVTTGKGRNSSMAIRCEKSDGSSQEWQITNLSADQFGNIEELEQGTHVRLIDFKIESNDSYRAKPTQNSVIWELP